MSAITAPSFGGPHFDPTAGVQLWRQTREGADVHPCPRCGIERKAKSAKTLCRDCRGVVLVAAERAVWRT